VWQDCTTIFEEIVERHAIANPDCVAEHGTSGISLSVPTAEVLRAF
jgi:hypothetical protein